MIVDRALARARFDRDITPALAQPETFARAGLHILDTAFPTLKVGLWWRAQGHELIVHVQADEYDYLPVQGWWVDDNDIPLCAGSGRIPVGGGFQANPTSRGLGRSWFCFPGWREYHEHPSHQDRPWSSLRHQPQLRILGVVEQLRTDLNKPGVQPQ
jgi:hypothetical protein